MVRIVGAKKGSGKTQYLINLANSEIDENGGLQVYIDYQNKYRLEINNKIRFIDTREFYISSPQMFFGFICGLIAGNYDIEKIYIDNITRIIKIDCNETATAFLEQLEEFTKRYDVQIVMTMTVEDKEEAQYLKKYNYETI